MKKAHKLLKIAALLLTIVMLVGCGSSNSGDGNNGTPAADGGDKVIVGYTCMQLTNPFHIAMRDTLKSLTEADGYTFLEFDGDSNQQKQNDAIDDMIAQGMNVLFLNPVDAEGVLPALEACEKAGVTVIAVDSNVGDPSKIATYISSDNFVAGQQTGEQIIADYPDGAKILVFENPLADSVVQRVAGLEAALEGSNSEIVDRRSFRAVDAILTDFEDLLIANPDANVVWGLNDDCSLIGLGAVESAGLQDSVKVYSVDGSPSGKISVQEGGLAGTAAQSPVGIAEKAYECFKDILAGKEVDAVYSLPTTMITAANVADNDPQNWG